MSVKNNMLGKTRICSIDIGSSNLAYLTADCDVKKIIVENIKKKTNRSKGTRGTRGRRTRRGRPILNKMIEMKKIDVKDMKLIDFVLIDLKNLNNSQDISSPIEICKTMLKSGKRKGEECGRSKYEEYDQCKIHLSTDIKKKIKKMDDNDFAKKDNKTKKITKRELCENMINFLNNRDITDCDVIVIEQQVNKNGIMIEISHYLYMYLLNRLIKEGKYDVKLMYLTARSRMNNICKLYMDECKKNGLDFRSNVKKYDRKVNAINFTNYIFNNKMRLNNKTSNFSLLRKKDDISDCFVQILWYLLRNNVLIQ